VSGLPKALMPHTCISLFAGTPTKVPAIVAAAATVYEGNNIVLTCTGDTTDAAANIAASYVFKIGAGTPVEKTGTTSAVYTKVAVPADAGKWMCAAKNAVGTGPYSTAVTIAVTGKFHSSMECTIYIE
jgi:hypothetical protein